MHNVTFQVILSSISEVCNSCSNIERAYLTLGKVCFILYLDLVSENIVLLMTIEQKLKHFQMRHISTIGNISFNVKGSIEVNTKITK